MGGRLKDGAEYHDVEAVRVMQYHFHPTKPNCVNMAHRLDIILRSIGIWNAVFALNSENIQISIVRPSMDSKNSPRNTRAHHPVEL